MTTCAPEANLYDRKRVEGGDLRLFPVSQVRMGRKAAVAVTLSSFLVVDVSRAKAASASLKSIHCPPCHPTACRSIVMRFRDSYKLSTSVYAYSTMGLRHLTFSPMNPIQYTASPELPISGKQHKIDDSRQTKLTGPPTLPFARHTMDTVITNLEVARCSGQAFCSRLSGILQLSGT